MNAKMIIKEVIETHGGIDYWNSLESLDAEISAAGSFSQQSEGLFSIGCGHTPVSRGFNFTCLLLL